jgi:DNA-binding MarR family transcriptional regulator
MTSSKAMTSSNLINAIAMETYGVSAALRRHGDILAKKAGQTQPRWQVLRAASDSTLSVPQIARRLGVTRQHVQRIADTLVAESLACYVVNPDHKTSSRLALTGRGRKVLEAITDNSAEYSRILASRLHGFDLSYLLASLKTLSSTLSALDSERDLSHPKSKTQPKYKKSNRLALQLARSS